MGAVYSSMLPQAELSSPAPSVHLQAPVSPFSTHSPPCGQQLLAGPCSSASGGSATSGEQLDSSLPALQGHTSASPAELSSGLSAEQALPAEPALPDSEGSELWDPAPAAGMPTPADRLPTACPPMSAQGGQWPSTEQHALIMPGQQREGTSMPDAPCAGAQLRRDLCLESPACTLRLTISVRLSSLSKCTSNARQGNALVVRWQSMSASSCTKVQHLALHQA